MHRDDTPARELCCSDRIEAARCPRTLLATTPRHEPHCAGRYSGYSCGTK